MVDQPRLRTPARVTLPAAALAARAVGGHLTPPLIVLVRGLSLLGLVLIRPTEATLAVGGAQASAGRLPWTLLRAGEGVASALAAATMAASGAAGVAVVCHRRPACFGAAG